jgi:acetoin utilization deacetylase AcuC-like enzyme
MILFYSDTFELPLPDGHRFPMSKYRLLRERVGASDLLKTCQLRLPPAATDVELSLAHDAEYVDRVQRGELSDLEIRRIGFPWSEKMVERSRRSSGASIATAAEAVRSNSVSINLAGGTHHASTRCGAGYCVFNDSCVAARVSQRNLGVTRVLILDLDVHQGNGSAEICQGDDTILTCSLHCDKNYPFPKADSDIDVALPEGIDDEGYLVALDETLARIGQRFQPQLVFFLAGADPYLGDRLGKMRLTKHGLGLRDQRVFDWCYGQRVPIAVSMAGGYSPDVNDIVDIHFQTISIARDHFLRCTGGASGSFSNG